MKKTLYTVFSVLMLALLIALSPTQSPIANAQVLQSDITAQRVVVKSGLIDVLREHVKLLQLVVIDRLEERVEYLQTLAEAQK